MRKLLAVAVILFSPMAVRAEHVSIAPFYGARFGGHFKDAFTGDSLNLNPSAAVGAIVNVPLQTLGESVELLYSHQDTDFSGGAFAPEIDVRVDVWQAGLLREFEHEKFRPFLVGTLGATAFSFSNGLENKTLFSIGMGGGFKYFPVERVGFRLDARAYVSFVEGSGAIACSGGCTVKYEGSTFLQGEVTPSVIVLF